MDMKTIEELRKDGCVECWVIVFNKYNHKGSELYTNREEMETRVKILCCSNIKFWVEYLQISLKTRILYHS